MTTSVPATPTATTAAPTANAATTVTAASAGTTPAAASTTSPVVSPAPIALPPPPPPRPTAAEQMATLFLQAMRLNATYSNKTAKDLLAKELEVLCDDMGWVTEDDLRKWPKIREFQEAIEVKPHGPIKPGSHLSKSVFRMQILNTHG